MSENHGIIAKAGKREKLENPRRVAELDPQGTLIKIGFQAGQIFCDLGAGSGLFSLAAAKMGAAKVYAVDTDAEILTDLQQRSEGIESLQTVPVNGLPYPMDDACTDWIMAATLFHEISDKQALLAEIQRILKPEGTVCLIDFIKARTPMGPSPEYRFGSQEAEELFRGYGFVKASEFNLGDDFYCQTYHR